MFCIVKVIYTFLSILWTENVNSLFKFCWGTWFLYNITKVLMHYLYGVSLWWRNNTFKQNVTNLFIDLYFLENKSFNYFLCDISYLILILNMYNVKLCPQNFVYLFEIYATYCLCMSLLNCKYVLLRINGVCEVVSLSNHIFCNQCLFLFQILFQ